MFLPKGFHRLAEFHVNYIQIIPLFTICNLNTGVVQTARPGFGKASDNIFLVAGVREKDKVREIPFSLA